MAQIFQGITTILNDVWDAITHALRVEPAGGTFPVSGTVTANQGSPNAGGALAWPVALADTTATGTLVNVGDTVTVSTMGMATVGFSWSGGTGVIVQLEQRRNGSSSWDSCLWADDQTVNNVQFQPISGTPRRGYFPVAGSIQARARLVAISTGSVSVTLEGSPAYRSLNDEMNFVADGSGNVLSIGVHSFNHKAIDTNHWYFDRTPFVFRTATASASGSTALWTPAAGKKVRLMRYRIDITDDTTLAVAGRITASLLDGVNSTAQNLIAFVPAAALDTAGLLATTGWVDLGNGILSAAANNVLNINLSAALSSGLVNVVACGTEE